jgi:hypothetical protein
MAIIAIGRRGDDEIEIGSGTERRIRRNWLITTDVRYFSELQLLTEAVSTGASGYVLPIPYVSVYSDDAAYLCKRLRARRRRNSPLHWEAEAEYDTAPFNDQDEEDENPLDRRAKFSWSTVKYQKAVEKDRNGEAIINSAGDYFDPPPLKDVSRWTVTVTKNMSVIPPGILGWRDRLNSDEFSIDGVSIAINVAKIMGISVGDIQKDQDVEYRVLSYTLEFDEVDKWQGKYLNQGYYGIVSGEKQRIQINGKDCVSPQLLTSAGVLIVNPSPSDATFEEYDVYDELTFTGNLPLD